MIPNRITSCASTGGYAVAPWRIAIAMLWAVGSFAAGTTAATPDKVTFDDNIQPIFRQHCLACHDAGGQSGGLALESFADVMAGGASGEIVDAGAGGDSRLYKLMAHVDKPIMPPGQDKLPDETLQLVKAWIDGGLLENAGSKAMKSNKPAVATFVPSSDNRPAGEPAMPSGFYREPVIHADRPGMVNAVAASPWAPLVAIAGQRQVLLYHSQGHQLLAVVPFLAGNPEVVRFSRNGDLLLVAGGRGAALGVAHLWDIKTGERIIELGDELDTILAADITPDHALVAIGGPRKRVQVLRTADGSVAYSITKHTDWVTALEFSPDGKHLVTADRSGNAHVWEARTGRPVAALAGHKSIINAVSWRGDSQVVATASDDRDFRLWKPTGEMLKQWGDYGGGVLDVAYTKDGRLVSAGRDGIAKLWNADGKEIRKLGKMNDMALAITTATNGDKDDALALFGDWTGKVLLADMESGEPVAELSANPPTMEMRIATASEQISQAKSESAAAKTALPKAIAAIAAAEQTHQQHNATKQAAAAQLATFDKQLKEQQTKHEQHQTALAQIDQAIEAVKTQQQSARSELATLREQLASVEGQQGEEADNTAANDLAAQVAAAEENLQKFDAKLNEAESPRVAAAEMSAQLQQAKANAAEQLKQQQAAVAALDEAAKKLPNIAELAAKKAALEQQLAEADKRQQQTEQLLADLKAEQAALQALPVELNQKKQTAAETIAQFEAELGTINQQLAEEQESVDTVKREIDELQKRIADLEKVRQQVAAIAGKTQESAQSVQEKMGEVSAEQSKIERKLSDLTAAAELREVHGKAAEADN